MRIVAERGRYSVREESRQDLYHAAPLRYTVWGPDVYGRICRMGDYGGSACRAAGLDPVRVTSYSREDCRTALCLLEGILRARGVHRVCQGATGWESL